MSLLERKRCPSRSSSITQLDGIVELAVVGDPDVARLVAKWLIGLGREIDDTKPRVPQNAGGVRAGQSLHAMRIGAAMRERPQAALHALSEPFGLRAYGAEDSAHVSLAFMLCLRRLNRSCSL